MTTAKISLGLNRGVVSQKRTELPEITTFFEREKSIWQKVDSAIWVINELCPEIKLVDLYTIAAVTGLY